MAKKYTVENHYGIAGETHHRTVKAALKAAKKREGEGWQVVDDDGHLWTQDFDGNPVLLARF